MRGQIPIHRWDPVTRQATRVATWPTSPATLGVRRRTPQGTTRDIMDVTLWPLRATWVALTDGTLAIVHPQPYHLEIIRPDGSNLRGRTVEYQPVPVSPTLREAVRKERGPVPDNLFPRQLPPFEGLEDVIGSPRGEIWVGRMQYPAGAVVRYDIFNAEGVRIREARLRSHSKVVGFGVGSIYVAREEAETGLWYLERYPDR